MHIFFLLINLVHSIPIRRNGLVAAEKFFTNFRQPGYKLECYYCDNQPSEEECNAQNNIQTCADNALSCEVCMLIV